MLKIILFGVVTLGLFFFSRPYLRDIRAHGFYRFFAFESILVLILLNLEHWFFNPFSVHQMVSWILLLVSLGFAIQGFYLLILIGKPKWGGFEKTTELVKCGLYRYIRHPLYASLILMGWGIFFKDPSSFFGLFLTMANTIFLFATAKMEEVENLRKFDSQYADYMKSTKMFIPFVI